MIGEEAALDFVAEKYDPLAMLAAMYDWDLMARPEQRAPDGDWRVWLYMAGRGAGKTRSGAEWVRERVEAGARLIHCVAPTAADVRDVMVEGPSGLLAVFPPHQRPKYEPSKRRVTFHTGAVALLFSADEPERLRGPQCDTLWCDEFAAWRRPEAFDLALMGLRLGDDPRACVTTTPKPLAHVRELLAAPGVVVTRGTTYDNEANLAEAFIAYMRRKYEGTRLGRQELEGVLLEDLEGTFWTEAMIASARVMHRPSMRRIVVAVDPSVTASDKSDECGIVVVGLGTDGDCYVLEDGSAIMTPHQWAVRTAELYREYGADRVIGEVNNGGDLVEVNLRTVAPDLPYRAVRASRGKATRAEPVAALYEQGRVHHVGYLAGLEAQMTTWVPSAEKSPDRIDALVWGVWALVLEHESKAVEGLGAGHVGRRGLDPWVGDIAI